MDGAYIIIDQIFWMYTVEGIQSFIFIVAQIYLCNKKTFHSLLAALLLCLLVFISSYNMFLSFVRPWSGTTQNNKGARAGAGGGAVPARCNWVLLHTKRRL